MSLLARYDTQALRVEPHRPLAWAGLPPPAVWQAMARWCAAAAPGAVGSACLWGGAPGEAAAVAEAFCRHLDGSTRLHRLSPWRGRLWRLQIKLREAVAWRARAPADPWDCGYLNHPDRAAPLAHLRPRRATLVVVDAGAACLAARHDPVSAHPLHWLRVGPAGGELRFELDKSN